MPIAIAAHQDKKIRMYDMRAGTTLLMSMFIILVVCTYVLLDCAFNWTLGECVGSLTAHQDSVTSLSVDTAGLYLASGGTVIKHGTTCIVIILTTFGMHSGHDGSLRVWSVADRHCVFEQSVSLGEVAASSMSSLTIP